MPIDKVKFPNGETEDIRDSRVPGIDSAPTANSANLVTSGGVKSALSGYLPLTGGTITGTTKLTYGTNLDFVDSNGENHSLRALVSWPDSLAHYAPGNGWTRIWDSGNDGSGSGLDADLLDGKHATDFIGVNDNAASATRIKEASLEDEEFTYQATPVHDIADGYRIDRVKGRTLVWNQLCSDSPKSAAGEGESFPGKIPAGHKILISYLVMKSTDFQNAGRIGLTLANHGDTYGGYLFCYDTPKDGSYHLVRGIVLNGNDLNQNYYYRMDISSGTMIIKDAMAIDLTRIFGAGNEPETVEEFEAMFPEAYYDYNPGELVNNSAEAIETEAADSSWTSRLALGLGSIKVKDSSGNILEFNGLASAGSVYDEIMGGKLIKRIGSVDLGPLNWVPSETNVYYSDVVPDMKSYSNCVCSKYASGAPGDTAAAIAGLEKTIRCGSDKRVYLKDSAGLSLSGVMLYYELATPVTYDLVSPVPLSGRIDGNGTMRVISDNIVAPFNGDITYGCNPGQIAADSNALMGYVNSVFDLRYYETSEPSGGMLPNREYQLGTLSGNTTFTLAAGTSGVTNHYFWSFETGSTAPTITWPSGITSWYGGSAPTINASKHYEVSVLDGVAICMEV